MDLKGDIREIPGRYTGDIREIRGGSRARGSEGIYTGDTGDTGEIYGRLGEVAELVDLEG